MICWFLPLQSLSYLRPQNSFLPFISDVIPSLYIVQLHLPIFAGYTVIELFFVGCLLTGCILFMSDYLRYRAELSTLLKHKVKRYDKEIYGNCYTIIESSILCGAMASGILKPTIWLGGLNGEKELEATALIHEATHIKHNDPMKVFVIQLLKRLMWWNLIFRYIADQTLHNIEMSCDNKCKILMGTKNYQSNLAKLILLIDRKKSSKLISNLISKNRNLDILRVKHLSMSHTSTFVTYSVHFFSFTLFITMITLMIMYGHTGLDGKRLNNFTLNDDQSFYLRLEQMPIKSIGPLLTTLGINSVYIHRVIAEKFIYINSNFNSLQELKDYFENSTVAKIVSRNGTWYLYPIDEGNVLETEYDNSLFIHFTSTHSG